MLAQNYKQIVPLVANPKKYANFPYIALALMVAALALAIAAIFVSYYMLIAAAVVFVAGIIVRQTFYSVIIEYQYICSENAFLVQKVNFLKKMTPVTIVEFESVLGFDRYEGGEQTEIFATDRADKMKLVYVDKGIRTALIISPDEYMKALIFDRLEGTDSAKAVRERAAAAEATGAEMLSDMASEGGTAGMTADDSGILAEDFSVYDPAKYAFDDSAKSETVFGTGVPSDVKQYENTDGSKTDADGNDDDGEFGNRKYLL